MMWTLPATTIGPGLSWSINPRPPIGSSACATTTPHIAVQEALDGKNVIWMEKVTDAEYGAGPAES